MTRLSSSIADLNEKLGVDGVIIHGKIFTNEELRALNAFHPFEWILANVGRTFKRPKGKQRYTIKDVSENRYGISAICDTPSGQREIPWVQLKNMEVVDAQTGQD